MGQFLLCGVEDHVVISASEKSQVMTPRMDELAMTHSGLTEHGQFVFSVDGETYVDAVTGRRYRRLVGPATILLW